MTEPYGSLIGVDELASSIREIDDTDVTPQLRDPQATTTNCPRCEHAMRSVTLVLVLQCEQDVWMPRREPPKDPCAVGIEPTCACGSP